MTYLVMLSVSICARQEWILYITDDIGLMGVAVGYALPIWVWIEDKPSDQNLSSVINVV